VFSYSNRSGTPAARIPEVKQVSKLEKKSRSEQLRAVAEQLQFDLHHAQLGKQAWVLPEKQIDFGLKARSEHYLTVVVSNDDQFDMKSLLGSWIKVEYYDLVDKQLQAKIISV